MRPRRLLLAVFVLGVAGVAALALALAAGEANAHPSDCHAQQTCPSDDHSYVWTDGSGQRWDCALVNDPAEVVPGATPISFDGNTYSCTPVGTTTTTTPTPPAPRPPPPATTPTVAEPVPKRPSKRSIVQERGPRGPAKPGSAAPAPGTARPGAPPVRSAPPIPIPKLTARGYVFPVYGPSSFTDTFGSPRACCAWHHGADIFAPLGAPILAITDGTLFSVGWNDIGGNRLWLRDKGGNTFYYAHLSAFSPLAYNGAQVKAGTVIGFVGTTGDAMGTPPHLHFEIHPVSRLYMGYDGAVNPTSYLLAWQRNKDVRFTQADMRLVAGAGWALPLVTPAGSPAPRPGAVLLARSDISSASGLEQGSLERALAEPMAAHSMNVSALGDELVRTERTRSDVPIPSGSAEVGGTAQTWSEDVVRTLVWDSLAQCEAGGDWSANTGNGYFGGLQFHAGTWIRHGGLAFARSAHKATRDEQIVVAERTLAAEGRRAWPACSAKLGLR
ncbi:MAG: transglycosylase family protein [Actinobacteria bacterium]|nr:transglycosylase family protein [Actinomycetota bacterium]